MQGQHYLQLAHHPSSQKGERSLVPTRCDTTKKSLFLNLLLSYVYGEAGLVIVLKEGTGIILLERKGLCGLHQCLDSWQMSEKAWTQCFPADHYLW